MGSACFFGFTFLVIDIYIILIGVEWGRPYFCIIIIMTFLIFFNSLDVPIAIANCHAEFFYLWVRINVHIISVPIIIIIIIGYYVLSNKNIMQYLWCHYNFKIKNLYLFNSINASVNLEKNKLGHTERNWLLRLYYFVC